MVDEDTPTEIPKDETASVTEKTDVEKRREEYETLKKENDNVEGELLRREQLKAKIALGGKTSGGQAMETPQEQMEAKAKKEADEIVNAFR